VTTNKASPEPLTGHQLHRTYEKLERRLNDARLRAELQSEHHSGPPPSTDSCPIVRFPGWKRGFASSKLVAQAQLSLLELEQAGGFTKHALAPESEYPTFLTRIPIFVPARRVSQRKLLDNENAMPFETPWGKGRKYGPLCTTYDEDTFIALGRLRQHLLIGDARKMPIPVSDAFRLNQTLNAHTHALFCMVSDLQSFCETTRGGETNKLRLESVRRLSNLSFDFERSSSRLVTTGISGVKLLDVAWQWYEDNAILYIQFTPLTTHCFENEYTYIDWQVRQQLSGTGKAVHRFLSSQPAQYEIHTQKLLSIIGFLRSHNKFLADLRGQMELLVQCRWLKSYDIVGTGKKTPKKLILDRGK